MKFGIILSCCWCFALVWANESNSLDVQENKTECVVPTKSDGSPEIWDITAPDDCYLRISCLIKGSGSCDKSTILISQDNRSTTICPTGSKSRHYRENRNYNTAQITILNGLPEVTAICQITAVSKSNGQAHNESQDPEECESKD